MGGKRGAFEREHAGARKGVCVCQRAHLYLQLGLAQPAWCCGIALRCATRGGQDAHARCHKFSMHDGHIRALTLHGAGVRLAGIPPPCQAAGEGEVTTGRGAGVVHEGRINSPGE